MTEIVSYCEGFTLGEVVLCILFILSITIGWSLIYLGYLQRREENQGKVTITKAYRFYIPSKLKAWTTRILLAFAATNLLTIIIYLLLDKNRPIFESLISLEYYPTGIESGTLAFLWINHLLQVASIILFVSCLLRMAKNIHALQDKSFSIKPGWIIAWFFIPFYNLVRPYTIMKMIWNESGADSSKEKESGKNAATFISIMWGLWLISNIFEWAAKRYSDSSMEWSIIFFVCGRVMLLIGALLAVKFIGNVFERQKARANARNS